MTIEEFNQRAVAFGRTRNLCKRTLSSLHALYATHLDDWAVIDLGLQDGVITKSEHVELSEYLTLR